MKALLVFLTVDTFTKGHTEFKTNKPYRCILEEDEAPKGALVDGEWFDLKDFKERFEPVIDRVHREWVEMGLIVNGKPLSKKEFKERLDCHKFGRGNSAFYSGYIYGSHPKVLMFQFTTPYAETKVEFINRAYTNYLEVVKGDWIPFDKKAIIRGNSGIPLSYGEIYWR